MAKNIHVVLDTSKHKKMNRKSRVPYRPVKYLDQRITPEERVITQRIYEAVQDELGDLNFDVEVYTQNMLNVAAPIIGEIVFDVDAGTNKMMQAVHDSGIRFGMDKFLTSVFK